MCVAYLNALQRTTKADAKIKLTKKLLDLVDRRHGDLHVLVRLLQPQLDVDRLYGIKHQALARLLASLLPAGREQTERQRLLTWRSDEEHGGELHLVAKKVLFDARCRPEGPAGKSVTVGEIDRVLNDLAALNNARSAVDDGALAPADGSATSANGHGDMRPGAAKQGTAACCGVAAYPDFATAEKQRAALWWILSRATAAEMALLTRIILKDGVSVGFAQRSFFKALHEDAQRVYDCTKSLEAVCRECVPGRRAGVDGIALGSHFSVQTCRKDACLEKLVARLAPDPFIVENKLDGWRLALHCGDPDDASTLRCFTRSDSSEGRHGVDFRMLAPAVRLQLRGSHGVILDGEILVWNHARHRFEDFNFIKVVSTAVSAGRSPDDLLYSQDVPESERENVPLRELEVLYVAFDILMLGHERCTHLPLSERHALLRRALHAAPPEGAAMAGGGGRARIIPLLPGATAPPLPGFPPSAQWSTLARSMEDVEACRKRVTDERWEGLVLKRLDAPYTLGRGAGWLKWKPDFERYLHDLDVLVVGASFGVGAKGGAFARYVVALAAGPDNVDGHSFLTFTSVGGGYTDAQCDRLNAILLPLCEPAKGPCGGRLRDSAPPWLGVGAEMKASDWPDVWLRSPTGAPVVEIIGDVRPLSTSAYATVTSIRFPRFFLPNRRREAWQDRPARPLRIRDPADKDFREVTSVAAFRELLGDDNKIMTRPRAQRLWGGAANRVGGRPTRATIDPRYLPSAAHVNVRSDALEGRFVHVLPETWASLEERDALHAAARSLGGTVTMNLLPSQRGAELVVAGSLVAAPPCAAGLVQQRAARVAAQTLTRHARHRGTDVDALHASWLLDCARARTLLPPQPRDYAHLSDKTLIALAGRPGFDMFGTELAPAEVRSADDVAAMLQTFVPTAAAAWTARLAVMTRHGDRGQQAAVPRVPRLSRAEQRSAAREVAAAGGLGGGLALAFFSVAALAAPSCGGADAAAAPEAVPPAWKLLLAQRARRFVELGDLDASTTDEASCPDVIVVLPSGSEDVLREALPHDRGAPLRDVAAAELRGRMAHWTPTTLVRALHAACPFLPMLAKLAAALASGATELASAAAALGGGAPPDDLGACAAGLGLAAGARGRALRDWVLRLPWEGVGVDVRAVRARLRQLKAKRAPKHASAPRKRPRAEPAAKSASPARVVARCSDSAAPRVAAGCATTDAADRASPRAVTCAPAALVRGAPGAFDAERAEAPPQFLCAKTAASVASEATTLPPLPSSSAAATSGGEPPALRLWLLLDSSDDEEAAAQSGCGAAAQAQA